MWRFLAAVVLSTIICAPAAASEKLGLGVAFVSNPLFETVTYGFSANGETPELVTVDSGGIQAHLWDLDSSPGGCIGFDCDLSDEIEIVLLHLEPGASYEFRYDDGRLTLQPMADDA